MTAQPPTCAICAQPITTGTGTTLPDIGKDGIPISRPVHRECARQAIRENEQKRKREGNRL